MRPSPALVLGPILGLSALITLLVTAFAWPTTQLAPRHLPIGLAGPAPAIAQIRTGLDSLGPDALDATVYPDRAAAVTAIENRDVYGAIVVSPTGPEVLTASAASPAVAQALGEAATGRPHHRHRRRTRPRIPHRHSCHRAGNPSPPISSPHRPRTPAGPCSA